MQGVIQLQLYIICANTSSYSYIVQKWEIVTKSKCSGEYAWCDNSGRFRGASYIGLGGLYKARGAIYSPRTLQGIQKIAWMQQLKNTIKFNLKTCMCKLSQLMDQLYSYIYNQLAIVIWKIWREVIQLQPCMHA